MEQDSFELSSVALKQEPPSVLPPADDSTAPQEEKNFEPGWTKGVVKEETPEYVLTLPPRETKKPGAMLKCDKCSFQTRNGNHLYLAIHKEIHNKPFASQTCQKSLFHENSLREHRRHHQHPRVTPSNSFACLTCKKLYSTYHSMRNHQKHQQHGVYANQPALRKSTFVCDMCNKSFYTPENLKIHRNAVHSESGFKCDVCGEICENRKSLLDHSRIHLHDRVECSICSKMFTKFLMVSHMRTHSAVGPTNMQGSLMIVKHTEKTLRLKKFGVELKCRGEANNLKQTDLSPVNVKEPKEAFILNLPQPVLSISMKEEPPEEFVCFLPQPSAGPQDEDELETEVKEEEIEPRSTEAAAKEEFSETFACDRCNKLFSSPENLKMHQNLVLTCREGANNIEPPDLLSAAVKEEPEEEFILYLSQPAVPTPPRINTCAACDLEFPSLLLLIHHRIELHCTVYNCNKCSYLTKNKQILAKHQKSHDQPFSCETCQKKFSMNLVLKFHQMQHRHGVYATAPKATSFCDICNKSFPNPNYLRQHQRKVHDEEEAKCQVCDKIYRNRYLMLAHRRRSHVKVECPICKKTISTSSKSAHLSSHSSTKLFKGVRPTKAKRQLKKLQLRSQVQSDMSDLYKPYRFQTKSTRSRRKYLPSIEVNEEPSEALDQPQPEDNVKLQAEAQAEPQMEHFLVLKPKWVKSTKLAKFDAKWNIKSKMFQTFQTQPALSACSEVFDY